MVQTTNAIARAAYVLSMPIAELQCGSLCSRAPARRSYLLVGRGGSANQRAGHVLHAGRVGADLERYFTISGGGGGFTC